jgi:hypothetical protein
MHRAAAHPLLVERITHGGWSLNRFVASVAESAGSPRLRSAFVCDPLKRFALVIRHSSFVIRHSGFVISIPPRLAPLKKSALRRD